MKKILFLILLILILINFNIFSKKIINPLDDNAKRLILEVEEIILEYKANKDLTLLDKAKSEITKLEILAKNNKYFEAKIIGLKCQLEIAYNKFDNIDMYISEIEKRNKNEEKLYIIKSEIEDDKKIKEKILLQGINTIEDSTYLKLYLANNYFTMGKFNKAAKYYDEIFLNLTENYQKAFQTFKDLSSRFSKNPPNNTETINILPKEEITVKDMLEIMLYESKLLSAINISQSDSITQAFDILIENDFFYPYQSEKISLDSVLKRKDLAYFLLAMLIKFENDPSLKNKYISNYMISETENNSPIPDVDINHYFFNAALVLIEKEILELPDGENFQPENYVSGLKIYEIIKNLDDYYQK